MGLLNEDFLDNMDNRSVLSDEEVEVSGEVKSPQDYPFMLEFRVSWFSYNNSPEKFMARLNSLSKAHFMKSMSIESDLKDEERGKKGAYLNFYVGFEPDFKNMKNILQFLNMCYNVVPLANDLMYIYDMGRNDHQKKGAWDIYFSNLNVYMHYINKGLLMLGKPTSDSYQFAIQRMMECASMMMTDDKKLPAAYYIEDRAKCNVFQRMTTFIGRLVDDYRIQIMKCGRVLPKAIRGKKLNLRSLIDNKNVDFIYSVNAQWQYSYKRTLHADQFKALLKQNGDELTITDFKFIINHKADVRMLISTGHFICEPEGSIPPKNKVKCLMTGMLSVYTTGYEPMYAWLQMQFGQDFMPHSEWKNIIRENGYS